MYKHFSRGRTGFCHSVTHSRYRTVNCSGTDFVAVPFVTSSSTVLDPTLAPLDAVRLSVTLQEDSVTEVTCSSGVTFAGTPDTATCTDALPVAGVMDSTALPAAEPRLMVNDAGLSVAAKTCGAGTTVNRSVADLVTPPPVNSTATV